MTSEQDLPVATTNAEVHLKQASRFVKGSLRSRRLATEGQRGRPRKHGKNRINLKKRATDHRGWQSILYACRGKVLEGRYKTFLATSHVVGGVVRVVLLEHATGNWAAYISSDTSMSVELIL